MRVLVNLIAVIIGMVVSVPVSRAAVSAPATLSVAYPSAGSTVSGTVNLIAAANAGGVTSVQFLLDGKPFGSVITAGMCRATWDTTTASNGPHTLSVAGAEAAGPIPASAPVTVTVNNSAPTPSPSPTPTPTSTPVPQQWAITSPANGATVRGNLTVTTAGPLPYRVELQRPDGTPVLSHVFNPTQPSPSHTFASSVLPSGPYLLALKTSLLQDPPQVRLTVTLDNSPIVTPTPIAVVPSSVVKTCAFTVTGTPPTTASGWSVQFYRDTGISFGTVDASAPFTRTSTLNAGSYQFYGVWKKSGVPSVTTAQVTHVCQ